jgi:hypothetical protein
MDMILVDWTRMGKTYCLAGVVPERGQYRVVRPLLRQGTAAPVRNVGWFAGLLVGHARWEVFELIHPEPAELQPPHLEDCWVRAMRSRRRSASSDERRAILAATTAPVGEPLFGVPFITTRMGAYLRRGTGSRSLATLSVPSNRLFFEASLRAGSPAPDVRVAIAIPGIGERTLPVKDHVLLLKAEQAASDPRGLAAWLQQAVRSMGDRVAVRLGLSRAFAGAVRGEAVCWLMADGFHSMADPQP